LALSRGAAAVLRSKLTPGATVELPEAPRGTAALRLRVGNPLTLWRR
jgi:hypothetical protein